jgi:hypothetical protein
MKPVNIPLIVKNGHVRQQRQIAPMSVKRGAFDR